MCEGQLRRIATLGAWLLAMSAHAASAESAEQAMAAWVPPSVMLAVIALLGGIVVRTFAARLDKMESTLEQVKDRMPVYVTAPQFEALKAETNAQLGRLGDRMDGRITAIASSVEVLKDRISRNNE